MKSEQRLRSIKEMIKKHEGWRRKPYLDTEGVLTIGYGFNIEQGISREEGDAILDIRLRRVFLDALLLEEFTSLDEIRKVVVINMIYNLGLKGVKRFKKMLSAIKNKDWKRAADEMLDSKWSKQVGGRAQELADIMRSGEIQDE